MEFNLEHIDGRIILVVTIKIWGGDVTERHDITDKFEDVVDEYVEFKFKEAFEKLTVEGE